MERIKIDLSRFEQGPYRHSIWNPETVSPVLKGFRDIRKGATLEEALMSVFPGIGPGQVKNLIKVMEYSEFTCDYAGDAIGSESIEFLCD